MLWPDKIVAPLARGTLDRIESVLADGEVKTDFLRTAVEAELAKRETKGATETRQALARELKRRERQKG